MCRTKWRKLQNIPDGNEERTDSMESQTMPLEWKNAFKYLVLKFKINSIKFTNVLFRHLNVNSTLYLQEQGNQNLRKSTKIKIIWRTYTSDFNIYVYATIKEKYNTSTRVKWRECEELKAPPKSEMMIKMVLQSL